MGSAEDLLPCAGDLFLRDLRCASLLLQSKIEDIKFELEEEAEKSIRLHFQMEQIVYCQDQVYQRALQRVREKESEEGKKNQKINSMMTTEEFSLVNISLSEIFEHLMAYHQVSPWAPPKAGFQSVSLSRECLFGLPVYAR